MDRILSALSWKLTVIKGFIIRGETATKFALALSNEKEQRGGERIRLSTFLLKIIDIGLDEYLRIDEINAQIKAARIKAGQEWPPIQ